MNKSLLLAAALAVLLSSCAYWFPAQPGDPSPVRLRVTDGHIVVNQEPIYVKTKNATLVWRVPFGSSLTFPENGITVTGDAPKGEFSCKPAEGGRVFVCIDANTKPGRYKYTIRLNDGAGKPIEALDPYIVNG